MVPIARKNLLAEKTRFAVAVAGVAFAVFLIVLIQSLFMGFRSASGAFIEDMPYQLWVMQGGTYDLYHASSVLPAAHAWAIRDVPGVISAQPIIGRQGIVEVNGTERRELFFAFEEHAAARVTLTSPAADLPERASSLPGLPASGEIIVSGQLGVGAGDIVRVGERELTVTGKVSEGGGFRSFSLLSYQDARELFDLNENANFIGVQLAAGVEGDAAAARIAEAVPGADVVSRAEFAERSRADIEVFTPILAVVLSIGFVVGAAVISLTIYTATIERKREFGVLKALGATRWYLYRLVTAQSFAVGLLGFAAGVPLAIGVSRLVTTIVPEFVTMFQPEAIAGVLGVVLLMSLVSAYLPAHRVTRIDPAMVFRA